MAQYVKFMRGTPDAYLKLTHKDEDTLYFIYQQDANEGLLYLGSKLIAGGESDLSVSSIDALKDVLITEGLVDKSLLVYNASQKMWINQTIDEAISVFIGAGSAAAGQPGLVPAPALGQTNLFLRSDGTWAPVSTTGQASAQVINIVNESKQPHQDIINEAIVGLDNNKGDLIIITDQLINDYTQQTAYVYDGAEWLPLNSHTVSSEQVIFVEEGKTLQEVINSIIETPDLDVDNVSISANNNILSLKNYGVQYYRFVEESEGVETHYELQIVDDEHPWASGLEPRVVEENGVFVLGWYEPNTTTIDGIQTQITVIQDDITDLNDDLNTKANVADVYTKLQVEEKIAAAAHLKRKEVESIEDIDVDAENADQYIYMVPSGLKEDDNKYYEYIVIELEVYDEETDSKITAKRLEKIGSWEVNLNDYAKIADVNNALATKVDKVDGSRLMTNEEGNKLSSIVDLIKSTDSNFTVSTEGQLQLTNIPNLADQLNAKVDKQEGWTLLSPDNQTKLESLLAITSIDETQLALTNGKLSISSISTTAINGLEDLLNEKASKSTVDTLSTSVANLEDQLNTYKTTTNAKLDELEERLTWQDLT